MHRPSSVNDFVAPCLSYIADMYFRTVTGSVAEFKMSANFSCLGDDR